MSDAPNRHELIALRDKGLTRPEIATHYGVTLRTVRRWITELGIPRPTARTRSRTRRKRGVGVLGEIIAPPDDGFTVLEKAKRVLGDRMGEKRGYGYTLDGQVCNVDRLLKAAGLST